ncbi:MAG: hypothetical protein IPQ07_22025 [Myxococcales bacterium]|nr:hypothetical protein [Myxococcales bacterium]
MNAAALVCPHCGKRRPDGEVGLAGKALSNDEVRALIAIHGVDEAPSQGLLPTLIFPHPSTHGTARTVELVCTIVALPMVILGALSVGLSRRRTRRSAQETTGELTPVLAASALGGLGLYSLLSFAGASTMASLVLIGGSIAALITRGAIRAHASSKRSRDLHRLAKPEPAPRTSRPQLPVARVETSRPSSPVVVAPPPRPAEAPRVTTDDPDEPSLLK